MAAERLPLAVYGTLRTGFGNHHLLASRIQRIAPGLVDGYELVINRIPYARPAPNAQLTVEIVWPTPAPLRPGTRRRRLPRKLQPPPSPIGQPLHTCNSHRHHPPRRERARMAIRSRPPHPRDPPLPPPRRTKRRLRPHPNKETTMITLKCRPQHPTPPAPRTEDGKPYRYEMVYDAGHRRSYANTLTELCQALIEDYNTATKPTEHSTSYASSTRSKPKYGSKPSSTPTPTPTSTS